MKTLRASLSVPLVFFAPLMLTLVIMGVTSVVVAGGDYEKSRKDIVATAANAGQFNTLISAVQAAGLVETLQGPGPFTVFAPTDDAFARIPKADLEALLADKDALTAVLTYHVVPGALKAEQVMEMDRAATVQGQSLAVDKSDGVRVGGARVVKADILASNGVIHVIDQVLLPN